MRERKDCINDAVWIGETLFRRGKISGSTANISFLWEGTMYITASGTCMGRLTEYDFAAVTLEGRHLEGPKPSKEAGLHLRLYRAHKDVRAVIHAHSFYATLWSCLQEEKKRNVIPIYTPYLQMRLGDVGLVDYAPPGSVELFEAFERALDDRRGYLLKNHGPIVGDASLMEAFYALEELEESARIAWEMQKILV